MIGDKFDLCCEKDKNDAEKGKTVGRVVVVESAITLLQMDRLKMYKSPVKNDHKHIADQRRLETQMSNLKPRRTLSCSCLYINQYVN